MVGRPEILGCTFIWMCLGYGLIAAMAAFGRDAPAIWWVGLLMGFGYAAAFFGLLFLRYWLPERWAARRGNRRRRVADVSPRPLIVELWTPLAIIVCPLFGFRAAALWIGADSVWRGPAGFVIAAAGYFAVEGLLLFLDFRVRRESAALRKIFRGRPPPPPRPASERIVMPIFATEAARLLAPAAQLDADTLAAEFVHPPKPEMGDLGWPCFTLAKTRKKAPPAIAKELADAARADAAFADSPFAEVRPVGPYVNFVVKTDALARATVAAALADPEGWGASEDGAGRTVVIDYSSPNIAKPLGVHHIRSTMIGAALSRIYAATGWKVVTVNHLGDWGTTFGQLMVAYQEAARKNPGQAVDVHSLLQLYVQFHAAADEDESLNDEARLWFKKLEDGDEEATRLWRIFLDESLKDLKALYARLNVHFDHFTGESFFNDKMSATLAHLRERNLLKTSDGAEVVDLEADGMPPLLAQKRDGATTYALRDLATAEYRHAAYGFDRCLYVVANQQELHFRQVFSTLEKMGYDWAGGCEHVKFGMLAFAPGVFGEDAATGSTRKGRVIFLEEVLDKAVARAKALILENAREPEVEADADRLAGVIGIGAVVFSEFLQRRSRDVLFSWERALNLHGDSGPYLQYTHARLSSLARRAGGRPDPERVVWTRLDSELERSVMKTLSEFSGVVALAARENEPSLVATYLLDLAALFNRMFTDKDRHRIVGDDAELTAARVALSESVRVTVARGLSLLGLDAPERM